MNKAVMISIQPRWCELIASGKKTIEVRKTRPQIETPFKIYIYCTMGETIRNISGGRTMAPYKEFWVGKPLNNISKGRWIGNGKVIGEFVCKKITGTALWRLEGNTGRCAERTEFEKMVPQLACLSMAEIEKYAGSETRGIYCWHISDLVIYDKPKELSDFFRMCPSFDVAFGSCWNCNAAVGEECECGLDGMIPLSRPPQSWCYVDGFIKKDGDSNG